MDTNTAASPEPWTKERIQKMIDDKIEEGSYLEYKAAASLENTDEITKDVSAFTNAAGGTIIYGVKEFSKPNNHLPERVDPVNGLAHSKEWLDQIICTIAPKIDRVQITPVRVGPDDSQTCYVVEVPQGATAHQARDCKYYRRYNTHAQPMLDHEIRDVMNRRKHLKLEFKIHVMNTMRAATRIAIRVWNLGVVVPKQYGSWVLVPTIFDREKTHHENSIHQVLEGFHYWRVYIAGQTPLFPKSDVVTEMAFRYVVSTTKVPEPSGNHIICTLYADDMPPIQRRFPAVVTTDWA